MSNGIERLQTEILRVIRDRPGGDVIEDWRGNRAELAAGIHDLRVIASQFTRASQFVDPDRQDAFRLAITELVERGILHVLTKVPMANCDPDHNWYPRILEVQNELFLITRKRERRFVRLNYRHPQGH